MLVNMTYENTGVKQRCPLELSFEPLTFCTVALVDFPAFCLI